MTTDAPDLKNTPRQRATLPDGFSVDRFPPYSEELEQQVLGCILLEPMAAIGHCVELLTATGEEFYDLRHQNIYRVCLELYHENTPPDLVLVYERMKLKDPSVGVEQRSYLVNLPHIGVAAHLIEWYLPKLTEKYLLRKLISTCTDALSAAYASPDASALIDQVEADILKIRTEREAKGERGMKELICGAINRIEDFHQNGGKPTGIPTGFVDLDKATSGLQNADMVVIAARPSMGKTSLAMNIVEHVAVDLKLPVGVFSLEMNDDSLALRLLCSRARVNLRNIQDGFMAERDFPKLTMAAGRLQVAPIYIYDRGGLSIQRLRAKARRMHQQYGVKLFVVDYMQLLHSAGSRRAENRQQEMTEISGGIKNLAKELNVPVIVLSQLNREVEKGKNRPPVLSDLRESGAIEQDADLVGMLYRCEETEEADGVLSMILKIAKQRNGDTPNIYLTFLKQFTRFESAAKISHEDMPGYQQPHND